MVPGCHTCWGRLVWAGLEGAVLNTCLAEWGGFRGFQDRLKKKGARKKGRVLIQSNFFVSSKYRGFTNYKWGHKESDQPILT